jgi:hypothetical protein
MLLGWFRFVRRKEVREVVVDLPLVPVIERNGEGVGWLFDRSRSLIILLLLIVRLFINVLF